MSYEESIQGRAAAKGNSRLERSSGAVLENGGQQWRQRGWVEKAESDLKTAVLLLRAGDECPADTVAFHAQQSSEKYLKAFLACKSIDFPKTHDIGQLILLLPKNAAIALPVEEQRRLRSYATVARYPGDYEPIMVAGARRAACPQTSAPPGGTEKGSLTEQGSTSRRQVPQSCSVTLRHLPALQLHVIYDGEFESTAELEDNCDALRDRQRPVHCLHPRLSGVAAVQPAAADRTLGVLALACCAYFGVQSSFAASSEASPASNAVPTIWDYFRKPYSQRSFAGASILRLVELSWNGASPSKVLTAPGSELLVLARSQRVASQNQSSPAPTPARTEAPKDDIPPRAGPLEWPFATKQLVTQDIESEDTTPPSANRAPAPRAAAPAGSASSATTEQGGFKLKVEVGLVLVEATVRDEHGGIVDNLKQEDFHLLEDGVEQEISYFSRDELPLAVALVVDRSGSMAPVLNELRRTAYSTLSSLKPQDEVALFDFAARAERLEDLTRDRQRIVDAIASIHVGGATVIPDALFEAALYLGRAAPYLRHAIILISDNENTLRGYSNESGVIRRALETETAIYSIKIGEEKTTHKMYVVLPIFRDVSVTEIAQETGGEVIEAKNPKTLQSAMATVITRLKQRYSLGYHTTNHRYDGTFRQIQIRITDSRTNSGGKYIVYARRGYYTQTEPAGPLRTQPQPMRGTN